ncbi:universal stress protein [Arcanobacterium buesumense]|uniref:UspA domain-containing protein n=1 Tax=Arcanobacterium buesumense TaxID=2722751 RepID=A0A6H2EL43_9ACTO|nr:universal stress protein [Arcanobacterium buesumense]QJC21681.1 hypothetical protein HC352_03615 [Arcanobacterium buesumense]
MSVIVPIGQQERYEAILQRGIAFAQDHDMTLIVLLSRSLTQYSQEQIDYDVDTLTDKLEQADVAFEIITRLDDTDLATTIRETALEHNAVLIITSLAPKPSHGSYQLGTQVQKLLVDAPCEVLIMRDVINT